MSFRRRSLLSGVLLALILQVAPAQVVQRLNGPGTSSRAIPNRYVVELTNGSVAARMMAERSVVASTSAKLDLHSTRALSHLRAVRQEQAKLRPQIEALGGRVLDSVDNIANDIFVQIDDAKAAQLSSLPGVKRVLREHYAYPTLDVAVQIHKVPAVWAAVGETNAGLGARIAIIDTGIDNNHPGFQDSTLPAVPGFPQVSTNANRIYTNAKVIVARSYPGLWPVAGDPDPSARDRVGHGTAAAMIAAGVRNVSPFATIEGLAPKAYLGNYKIYGTPGINDGSSTSSILKGMADALGDGMDVINLSSGVSLALDDVIYGDAYTETISQLSSAGVLFVTSAGNSGPDLNTIGSPANSPEAISVGAISNGRIFGAQAQLSGGTTFIVSPFTGNTTAKDVVNAKIVDISTIDGTGEACSLPTDGSLKGDVALVVFPPTKCTTTVQFRQLVNAGIVAAILVEPAVYGPSYGYGFFVGTANPPSVYIDSSTAVKVKAALKADPTQTVSFTFAISPQTVSYNQLAGFSSLGPTDTGAIKPDLLAVGTAVVTATQKFDRNGEMYDPSGYTITQGTSFSSPMVAGAAALIKAARPGLTTAAYRSLLINNTDTLLPDGSTIALPVQQTGSGILDAYQAYTATVALEPTSLAFGVLGYNNTSLNRSLRLTNIGKTTETYTITATPRNGGRVPTVFTSSVTLDPGQQRDVTISFSSTGLTAGAVDGYIRVVGSVSGQESRVPFFYAVPGVATRILILGSDTAAPAGTIDAFAIGFRIYDDNGIALTQGVTPTVTVVSGGGKVESVALTDLFGSQNTYGVTVQLGPTPGPNVFKISVGSVSQTVTIQGISGN